MWRCIRPKTNFVLIIIGQINRTLRDWRNLTISTDGSLSVWGSSNLGLLVEISRWLHLKHIWQAGWVWHDLTLSRMSLIIWRRCSYMRKTSLLTRHVLGHLTTLVLGRWLLGQYSVVHRHWFHSILLSIFKILGNPTHSAFRLLVPIHLTIWDHIDPVMCSIFAVVVHFWLINIFKILLLLFGLITSLKHSFGFIVHQRCSYSISWIWVLLGITWWTLGAAFLILLVFWTRYRYVWLILFQIMNIIHRRRTGIRILRTILITINTWWLSHLACDFRRIPATLFVVLILDYVAIRSCIYIPLNDFFHRIALLRSR